MNNKRKMKFKKGAASFYIVAFATLILMIIATSFAAIIISEVTRTSNDDLAQSAYDSALAGIEDAKLAFYNYKTCKAQGVEGKKPDTFDSSSLKSCESIVWFMENGAVSSDNYNSCDMVSMILGRSNPSNTADNEGGTVVSESTGANNMQQLYTCTKIETTLRDYRSTLSSSQQMRIVKVKFDDIAAKDIKSMKLSWYSDASMQEFKYTNFNNGKVVYPALSQGNKSAVPPTVYLGMIQTSTNFTLDKFDTTRGNQTNRGMIYMTPTNNATAAALAGQETYKAGYDKDNSVNRIGTEGMLTSNDKTITKRNLPYLVYCPEDSGNEFACSVIIDLPEPIDGNRSDETFVFVAGLPYGKPTTDFAMEFYCGEEGTVCPHKEEVIEEGEMTEETNDQNVAYLDAVQIKIDSTGRANDLYRRVEARLEGADEFSLSLMGPLELLGGDDDDGDAFEKTLDVKCEHNFPPMTGTELTRRPECN